MNLRYLEAFLWVAKLGSFKAAAEKMHTTQAGLSSRIASLEEHFCVRLFDRGHRSVVLTSHGTELIAYAERMLELHAQAVTAIGRPEAFTGMLRVGVIETVAHTWLPSLLQNFSLQYPKATLEISSDITPRLRDDLLKGALDCAILSEEITPGFIENHRISNFAMRWVASPALALKFPARAFLSFADLAEFPIISFHRDSGVYRNIAINAAGLPQLRVSYFSSLGAMVDLTRSGFGSSVLPVAVIQQDLAQGRLVLLDVEQPPASLPLIASTRLNPHTPLADALVRMARAACDEFVRQGRDDIVAPF
ncbi:LysR family transcriptional regulator [Xylophilus sp. GOD-11R]|uniref:LysR family transcriptional regulator n=1 Tax=Xylophilus sp. GOD-11R TaxID=3089814 RepID=UPI00298C6F1B|nr:LysR family transcriptional regulator [Xylophilus sp. GOD-11R]WPB57252.1 LysR family transcriptional regulator [Xylophilus sp. GOD-11R]